MTDAQLDRAFAELRRGSQASLVLMLVGVLFLLGSVYYAATRLRPLELEISQRKAQVEQLAVEEVAAKRRIAALQRDYATLRASAEKLYAVRVTPGNQVYELKATAQATGRTIGNGAEYRFAIYVNSPERTLESIDSVAYRFDHPTFEQKQLVTTDAGNHFRVGYVGWGCLDRVGVTVTLQEGTTHNFDFDMCRSLGPQWGDTTPSRNKTGSASKLPSVANTLVNKLGLLPDMATPPHLPPSTSADRPDPPTKAGKHPPPADGD